jgi:DNA-binding CsgD family transcriptional regulator
LAARLDVICRDCHSGLVIEAGALLGRSQELATLIGALEGAAERGSGAVIVVEGEAGIGKTALVDAVLARAAAIGMPVYRAAAREMERNRPFGVLCDALDVPGDATGERQRDIAALLRSENSPALDAAGWAGVQFRVGEALLALVDELSESGPAVLVAEDLHWADPSSLVVLARLARAIATTPVVLICTLRPSPRRSELSSFLTTALPDAAILLQLGPLSDRAVWQLAEQRTGAPIGPRLRGRLTGAGGNPLFVQEVMSGLLADGALVRDAEGRADVSGGESLPSLAMAVLGHLSFLNATTVKLLGIASVLGTSFSLGVLSALTGQPVAALWSELSEALAARVLTEEGDRLAFRHDLIHEAFYNDLPIAVRRALHTEAASVLEQAGADSATVAEHVLRSTHASGRQAVTRLRRAADDAARSGAPAVANDLLVAALTGLDADDPMRAELTAERGLALLAAGRAVEAESLLRTVLTQGSPAGLEASLRAALQQSLMVQGRLAEAFADAEICAASEAISTRDQARFAARAATGLMLSGNFGAALEAAVKAEERGVAVGDVPAQVAAILTQAHVAAIGGTWSEAISHVTRAVDLAAAEGTMEALQGLPYHVQTQVLTDVDDIDGALKSAAVARATAESSGIADDLVVSHLVASYVLFWSGRWDDAVAAAETATSLAEETDTAWQVDGLCLTAVTACWQGLRDRAWAILNLAEAKAAAGGVQFRVGWIAWTRSVLEEADGRSAAARQALLPAWQACQAVGAMAELRVYGPQLAALAVAAGQTELASEVASALHSMALRNPDLTSLRAAARTAEGLSSGDPDTLLEALALHRDSPRAHDRARCAEAAAAALAAAGRLDEARTAAAEALDLYSSLGAEGELARARAILRAAGLRLGVRGPRRRPSSGWAALTNTEIEVARLVARRLSNPEIARMMFLSRRTVGHHVSHLLAKLGMSSRAEIVSAAARGSLEQLGEYS